nr:bHLH28 transcription factor [Panax quinquefolius]
MSLPEEGTNFPKSLSPESYSYTSFLTTTTTDHQEPNNNHKNNIEIYERPSKQIKTNPWKSIPINHVSANASSSSSSSSSHLISFANFTSQPTDSHTRCGDVVITPVVVPKDEIVSYEDYLNQAYKSESYGSLDYKISYSSELGGVGTTKRSSIRSPLHAQDHVIAERKRRERLTERFIALSAIVPDLKKICKYSLHIYILLLFLSRKTLLVLDKASVLGDAIKYLKHLQERVKLLEEQIKKKKSEETINSSKLFACHDSSSCNENSGGCFNKTLPEIEARVSEKNVLIRIHCEKQKGFIPKMLSEIEKHHLTVINSSVLPFGGCTLDITIVAQVISTYPNLVTFGQLLLIVDCNYFIIMILVNLLYSSKKPFQFLQMDDEFCSTLNGLVRNLQTALQ